MRIRLVNNQRTGQGPLFSRGPRGPNSRISAEEKLMSADNFLQKQQKQPGRPFEKGRSGNPAGRPRGSRNRSTLAAQLMLRGDGRGLDSQSRRARSRRRPRGVGVFRSYVKPRAAGAATPTCARRERASSGARLLALMIDEGVTGHAFSRQLVELRRTQINVAGAQAH
jgi:hypothetical protein